MARDASALAHRLAREAEAVCRHYLSNGKRQGRYWLVGDVHNTPGRSMFVRLRRTARLTANVSAPSVRPRQPRLRRPERGEAHDQRMERRLRLRRAARRGLEDREDRTGPQEVNSTAP